jgi:hypothetical protein
MSAIGALSSVAVRVEACGAAAGAAAAVETAKHAATPAASACASARRAAAAGAHEARRGREVAIDESSRAA